MELFFRKKKESARCGQTPGAAEKSVPPQSEQTPARVKVLGSGCAKCRALEDAAKTALRELDLDPTVDHVTDFSQIAAYGVMSTPALVVDGKVVSCGKVLTPDEVKDLIGRAGR